MWRNEDCRRPDLQEAFHDSLWTRDTRWRAIRCTRPLCETGFREPGRSRGALWSGGMTRKPPDNVASVVEAYPAAAQQRFHSIRRLIHREADRLEAGPLTETLKWGEPSFLTEASRTGTTIRLAWKSRSANEMGVYVHCQTSLVDGWRDRFPELKFDGNRALLLPLDDDLPEDALLACISDALTHHRRKRA